MVPFIDKMAINKGHFGNIEMTYHLKISDDDTSSGIFCLMEFRKSVNM